MTLRPLKTKNLNMNNNILIIGECGVGKTWVMLQLIEKFKCIYPAKSKLLRYSTNDENSINITGKYEEGAVFQGSDKLAMNVMSSVDEFLDENWESINIYEGDRFSNSKFIDKVDPVIIRINGNGKEGREKRGSNQTERQLKSIRTRVNNLTEANSGKKSTVAVRNSEVCLQLVVAYIEKFLIDEGS